MLFFSGVQSILIFSHFFSSFTPSKILSK